MGSIHYCYRLHQHSLGMMIWEVIPVLESIPINVIPVPIVNPIGAMDNNCIFVVTMTTVLAMTMPVVIQGLGSAPSKNVVSTRVVRIVPLRMPMAPSHNGVIMRVPCMRGSISGPSNAKGLMMTTVSKRRMVRVAARTKTNV